MWIHDRPRSRIHARNRCFTSPSLSPAVKGESETSSQESCDATPRVAALTADIHLHLNYYLCRSVVRALSKSIGTRRGRHGSGSVDEASSPIVPRVHACSRACNRAGLLFRALFSRMTDSTNETKLVVVSSTLRSVVVDLDHYYAFNTRSSITGGCVPTSSETESDHIPAPVRSGRPPPGSS